MKRIPVLFLLRPLPALSLLLTLFILLTGCSATADPAYDPADFSCTLSIDSVSTGETGRFTAEYICENGRTVLTLTAPERLAGITFTFTEHDCTLTAEDCKIPLSDGAAGSLRGLTNLLSYAPEDASDSRSDGENTILFFTDGQLTLDSTGMPLLAETGDGRRAQILPTTPVDR